MAMMFSSASGGIRMDYQYFRGNTSTDIEVICISGQDQCEQAPEEPNVQDIISHFYVKSI